ncbi:PREDICTED: histidine kinase 2-like isoform X1 [Ipomoea nil]|uniref:histidine kinase 2-like isoform X1 n=2 Tax=Ipomoea nil TaxID=35883 RepID=UPI000900DFFE|nr:PREDICTED: histidine kinase 2-like isoform X1 [Ipomoea nil]XP_019193392.1 PREDICTED: histidine kinase 2-like isoform X1 [Ipomoea nil]
MIPPQHTKITSFGLACLSFLLPLCSPKRMSMNCKSHGMKGGFSSKFRLKKPRESQHGPSPRRRQFLFLWLFFVAIGFICLLISSSYGSLGRKKVEPPPHLDGDTTNFLLQHFNVSREEIHALASYFLDTDQISLLKCSGSPRYGSSLKNTITCVLKVLTSENQVYEKKCKLGEKLEAYGQCPVSDENIFRNIDSVLQQTSSSISSDHQFCEKETLKVRALGDQCKDIAFCFTKIFWWILLGIAVSWKLRWLRAESGRNEQQKLVSQQESSQQPQLLQHLQQQQAHAASRVSRKLWEKLLVTFVLSGVIGSICLFWYMNEDIMFWRKETLASMCDERARMLQDQFNVSMNHVHALAILVSTFHHGKQPSAIDQKTFEEYTERTAFERPLTSGVAYALRVLHSERENFERQHGWAIKKMESEDQTLAQEYMPGNLDRAPDKDEYAPVIFSQQTVSHIVSIDMMSGKEDRENILRARASGKGVLTSPFKLLKSNNLGVVLTFAVYNTHLAPDATPDQRINATVGYIGASYDVPSLVEKLLHQLASKHTIVVNVYDTTNTYSPIKMYGTDETETELLHVSNLDFGDPARKHEMHCRFKQKPPPPWIAIGASIGVLVITLLVGHIFHAAIARIAKFEHDYQKMMNLKHRAEAADIAKSQFLATVSHEIRTPMNGVLGMLQMLMDTNLDATQRDFAQTAHASGKDLISLINEVLDQAKIESGHLELEAVSFDLRAVLDNVLSLSSGRSHEKGIELAAYVSDQVPETVVGDPGRFRQIIVNLVGNSIKFTKNKEGHVFVTVHLADEVRCPVDVKDEVLTQSLSLVRDPTNRSFNTLSGFPVVDRWRSWQNFKKISGEERDKIKLLVSVEDTGVGISLEAQGRIFTPFMQADSSTSRTYGGTGIGLSISKHLVDLMGGEIGFFSEPGTGSTFSFTAAFSRDQRGSVEAKWQQYDPGVLDFHGLRALVIDGKRIRAEVTRYHLQRLGLNVEITSTVDHACSYLSTCSKTSEPEHLVMIFIDKDNWDTENSLKGLRPYGSTTLNGATPKLFLLATEMSSTECNQLKSDGLVDNVLIKPIRLSVLASCLQEATGFTYKRQVTMPKPSTLGNLLKDKQILVVDDNVVNRRVAEGALKKYGAIVTCVDGGKAALALLKPPHNFDACFMDLQMPEMDGFEATRQIRRLENEYRETINCGEILVDVPGKLAHWRLPILAMTADVIRASNEECMRCGMDDYVSKPFDEGQLYSALARFFGSG